MKYFTPLLLTLSALLFVPMSYAQPGDGNKKEKVEQLKIAFITRELQLTSEEAEKFWPVYNEMTNALRDEKKAQRKITRALRDNKDSYSEEEFKTQSLAAMDSQIKSAELKKEYHIKLAEIISYKKATKLLSLEQRFKQELLKRLNNGERKPGGGGPNGQRPNRND